jgi:hypothetical protein
MNRRSLIKRLLSAVGTAAVPVALPASLPAAEVRENPLFRGDVHYLTLFNPNTGKSDLFAYTRGPANQICLTEESSTRCKQMKAELYGPSFIFGASPSDIRHSSF